MKITIKILLLALLMASCKKNDDDGQVNTAPEAFNLLTIENQVEDAALSPTFTWQAAMDIDGDSVVYDFYLEMRTSTGTIPILGPAAAPPDPTIILAQGLTETSFTITDPLPTSSSFTWKVVARDNQGGAVESEIFRFSTRLLNFGDEAHTAAAAFDVREGHGSLFFKEKFWVIGGFANIEDLKNDVWSSTDGKNWVQETADAGFNGRSQFGITIFNERIFIIGGIGSGGLLGDVWSSADGVDWVQETASADFSPRAQTKLVAYKNKLYALGGLENLFDATTGSTNDVWSSTNGVDWVRETDAAPYSERYGFEALVYDDKIFMLGGALVATFEAQADVWYSTDGKNWTQTQQSGIGGFTERVYFNSTVFNGKIWLAGGFFENVLEEIHYTDFWSSSDGTTWKRELLDAGYGARSFSTLVSNQEYMLLIGGRDINADNKYNDVWKFD